MGKDDARPNDLFRRQVSAIVFAKAERMNDEAQDKPGD
jgi:hypothetical protein